MAIFKVVVIMLTGPARKCKPAVVPRLDWMHGVMILKQPQSFRISRLLPAVNGPTRFSLPTDATLLNCCPAGCPAAHDVIALRSSRQLLRQLTPPRAAERLSPSYSIAHFIPEYSWKCNRSAVCGSTRFHQGAEELAPNKQLDDGKSARSRLTDHPGGICSIAQGLDHGCRHPRLPSSGINCSICS